MTVIYRASEENEPAHIMVETGLDGHYVFSTMENGEYTQVALSWTQTRDLFEALHRSLMETV